MAYLRLQFFIEKIFLPNKKKNQLFPITQADAYA